MPAEPGSSTIVSTPEAFRALGPAWDRLASRFRNPLLFHPWFLAAVETIHRRDRLCVFLRKRGDDFLAIAPMVERTRLGVRTLELIGTRLLTEPSGLLYERPIDLRALIVDLTRDGRRVELRRVGNPVLIAELSSSWGVNVPSLSPWLARSPWIRIEGGWDEYYRGLSPKWRSAHRRALKKAGPGVSFDFHSPTPVEFDGLMAEFIQVEGMSWKSRSGTSLAKNGRLRSFFTRYGEYAAARGNARFAFMRAGGEPIAAHFGVVAGGRHWLLKIGHDERWSHCSPGILLMHAALERSFDERLEAFEFLGSNEPWLEIWKPRAHRYYSRAIDPLAVRRGVVRTISVAERIGRKVRRVLARSGRAG